MRAPGWRGQAAATLTALALVLTGCEDTPAVAPGSAATASSAPAASTSVPGGIVLSPQPVDQSGGQAGSQTAVALPNDPSAPGDTPLCGTAAREADAIGQALLPRQFAQAGICRSFACYDPATATYIGADGYRHVCR